MTMIAFGGHSLDAARQGRAAGTLTRATSKACSVATSRTCSLRSIRLSFTAVTPSTQEMKRAIAREVDPWSNVPREQRTRTLSATLPGMVDEHSLADDGGGLGAELITADEVLGYSWAA